MKLTMTVWCFKVIYSEWTFLMTDGLFKNCSILSNELYKGILSRWKFWFFCGYRKRKRD